MPTELNTPRRTELNAPHRAGGIQRDCISGLRELTALNCRAVAPIAAAMGP